MTQRANYQAIVSTPIAQLGIVCDDTALLGIDFLPKSTEALKPKTALAKEVARQLQSYFANPDFEFDLPLELDGTRYQQRVWQRLLKIKSGQTKSYGQVADQIESGARAVGNACRANPIPIVVPCHRVIAAQGLGGFAGKIRGLNVDRKRWLLTHEKSLPA